MKPTLSLLCALLLGVAFALPAHAGETDGEGRKGKGKRKHAGKLFKKFDKDKSGSLTSDEVPAKAWTRLVKADADGDGAVTKAEIAAKRKSCGGKKGERKGRRKGRKGGKGGADGDA